jgi:RHS repeat-associated protein
MRLLVCILLSATAQASNYRFGASQDRVVTDEEHGYTQHIAPDFEVQDGIAVTYVRLGRERVARLVATDYAAKVYTDVAPLDGADGKITAGDAWISQQAQNGALSLPVTPTAVDRLLLSGARRILYESAPTTVYFAHDQLGSMTVETDDQGAVVGRRAYSTFGAERAYSGDGDSYGFTGQRQDDSGTVHFSFRQLDPMTGRWSSTDPLFHLAMPDGLDAFGEATTSYAYVGNNPASDIDPTGLVKVVVVGQRGLSTKARGIARFGAWIANPFRGHENKFVAQHQYLAVVEVNELPNRAAEGSNPVVQPTAVHADAGVKKQGGLINGTITITREKAKRYADTTYYEIPELRAHVEDVERFLRFDVETKGGISRWGGYEYTGLTRRGDRSGNCQGYVQRLLERFQVHWDVVDRRSTAMAAHAAH